MKISNGLFKTYKENPSLISDIGMLNLVKAGYLKEENGVKIYLPLYNRLISNIEKIIFAYFYEYGISEIDLSYNCNNNLSDLSNKNDYDFLKIIKNLISSYKQLPLILYKKDKFDNLLNGDYIINLYSFDKSINDMNMSFEKIQKILFDIFNNLDISFLSGCEYNSILNNNNKINYIANYDRNLKEFVTCNCGYISSIDNAKCEFKKIYNNEIKNEIQLIETLNIKTINDLSEFLNIDKTKIVKTIALHCDKGFVLALLRGDRELSLSKLKFNLGVDSIEFATNDDILKFGSVPGFIGPINMSKCLIIADNEIKNMVNFVIGSNKLNYHYINANIDNLKVDYFSDIRKVDENDVCPLCGKNLKFDSGECFCNGYSLGTSVTKKIESKFLDINGKLSYIFMNRFTLNVTKILYSIVSQHLTDVGMVLPKKIAPYEFYLLVVNTKDDFQISLANNIYNFLSKKYSVLFDDRQESFGTKITDAELMGIPYIIVVGNDSSKNIFELIDRLKKDKMKLSLDNLIANF